jgi:serine/threonine-protein kinase HipA
MIRAIDDTEKGKGDRQFQSFRSATHIVKFWDPREYPELVANEHFWLSAAKALGLIVPNSRHSDSGARSSSSALTSLQMGLVSAARISSC